MKKTALAAIAVVAVIAVLIVGILSLNYDFTPNPHVEITSFASTGTSSGSDVGDVNVWFILNLTNTGTVDAQNLTVTFSTNRTIENHRQLIYTNSSSPHDHIVEFTIGELCLLEGMRAGETKNFTFYWPVSVGFDAPPLTVTLKSNQATLDQATTMIPPIPNAKITNFVCLDIRHYTRLGLIIDLFSLSYTNLGKTDVKDLTITLNTSKLNPRPRNTSHIFLDELINGETYLLENLRAKETKTIEKSYGSPGGLLVQPFALTATLKSNNTILDQATLIIPISDY